MKQQFVIASWAKLVQRSIPEDMALLHCISSPPQSSPSWGGRFPSLDGKIAIMGDINFTYQLEPTFSLTLRRPCMAKTVL